jgi:hypothetical protein
MTVAAQIICYSVADGENADTKIAAQIGGSVSVLPGHPPSLSVTPFIG